MNDKPTPDNERVDRYLAGDMPDEERKAFEEEILDNPELAAIVYADVQTQSMISDAAGAKRIERAGSPGAAAERRRWWQLPSLQWGVVSAAVVVIAVLVLLTPDDPERRGDVFRGGEAQFQAVSPSGDVGSTPSRFVWTRHPGATHYRFELFDAESHSIHASVTRDTTVVIAVPGEVVPTSGHWTVTPLKESLTAIGPSAVTSFQVIP